MERKRERTLLHMDNSVVIVVVEAEEGIEWIKGDGKN